VAEGRCFTDRAVADRVSFKGVVGTTWWERHGPAYVAAGFAYHLPTIRATLEPDVLATLTPTSFRSSWTTERQGVRRLVDQPNIARSLCSTFNFAIKREQYDRNPVSAVAQRKEPPRTRSFLVSRRLS